MFIYYYKIWSLFTRMFAAFILGVKNVQGWGAPTEIFEINLQRTWCVYIDTRISRKNGAQDLLILAYAGR